MPISYISPRFQAIDLYGRPMVAAKLYTYQNGTTTPHVTYKDADGSTSNTNPIILDARGEAVLFLDADQVYTFVLKDVNDATVWTQDSITGNASAVDVETALKLASTDHAGPDEPELTWPYMTWADTGTEPPVLMRRNAADDDWLTIGPLFMDQTTRIAIFTSNGTFTIPEGVTEIYVSATAAGGGGGGGGGGGASAYFGAGGAGGGAGEYIVKKQFDVSSVSTISITVGGAGSGGSGTTAGGSTGSAGGSTIIGSLQSLGGGQPGQGGSNGNGALPVGGGIGGSGYPRGEDGENGFLNSPGGGGGNGGNSAFGGGGSGRRAEYAGTGYSAGSASGYGAGGGGGGGIIGGSGSYSGGNGGNGAPGIVIIEW